MRGPWWLKDLGVPRTLRWALTVALAGIGCVIVSLVLSFTWAATGGRGGWLAVAHWLNLCGFGCAAVVWGIALVSWLRKRRRAR